MYAPLIMLLVDSVLYFFLAVYFDHIIPGKKLLVVTATIVIGLVIVVL